LGFNSAAAAIILCIVFGSPSTIHAETPEIKYFVEVSVPSLDAARELSAAGFDIAGVNREAMTVGVVVTQGELADLQARGWPLTVRSTNAAGRQVTPFEYHDPVEIAQFVDEVVAAYPTLAKKLVLKETLFEGQEQIAVLITKDVPSDNDRPSFLVDAQHHAREVMTPEIAMDMIDYLTSRYATDAAVQRWVDNVNIYVVPSVNPDGAMYAFTTDAYWRKNRHPGCGVDINRNYSANWGACNGSENACSSETNRGEYPASEPETQGMMQLMADTRPFFSLTYHSFGEYLMYSYGCSDPDEQPAFQEIAQGLNAILENDHGVTGQYATGVDWSTLYITDGTSKDTAYNWYGSYAYIIEVNANSFTPDFYTWRNPTVRRQRIAWQYFLDKTLDGPQIRGTVTDAVTGLPLAANVSLQEVTFTHGELPRHADAKGHYRLLVHTNGTYHVSAAYLGYCTVTQEAAVGTGPFVADAALVHVPAIPQGVTASAPFDHAVDLSWQPVAVADQYQILRSLTTGGPYALVASVPGTETSYHDASLSGSTVYHYVVRAVTACASANSTGIQIMTTGSCTIGPAFAGASSVTNAASPTCALNVTWPTATAPCGGEVTYSVYRSASAPFAPGPGNLVASGLHGSSYSDHGALANATPYYYLVRAVDAGNGADDGNLVTVSARATGPDVVGTWTDDAGDTGTARMTLSPPWSVMPTGGKAAPRVYATGSYGPNLCSALTTPIITLATIASATGQVWPVLTFASKYDFEANHDAGVVEAARGPNFTSWAKLPVTYPDPFASFGPPCGLTYSALNTVFSRTIATPAYPASLYSASLAGYDEGTVKIRWRLASDVQDAGNAGWWIDDISVTLAVLPDACAPGAAPNPKEASPDGGMKASRGSSGTAVDLVYNSGCGTLDNAVFWGAGPIFGSPVWTAAACAVGNSGHAAFDPGPLAPGGMLYFVIVGQNAANEGSYGAGTAGERPEAVGIGACDKPQVLGGTCP